MKNLREKIREKINIFIKPLAQSYADFLISRLEDSKTNEEFQMWFSQALYFDFYCTGRNIYLD